MWEATEQRYGLGYYSILYVFTAVSVILICFGFIHERELFFSNQ